MALQSTLPHGERRERERPPDGYTWASIHAPARGATTWPSISSPRARCFNPRSRTGSDVSGSPLWRCLEASIHAPARGATNY